MARAPVEKSQKVEWVDELRFIDPGPVRAMRAQEEAEAQKLRAQIAQLQEQLAVREARIAVLDEVLTRCKVALEAVLPPQAAAALAEAQVQTSAAAAAAVSVPAPPPPEPRRATASSMEERRAAVEAIFRRHGDMTPRDLLPLVNDELGEELLPHQLRAVLRKYTRLFEGRADQHGIWGLIKR